MYLYNLQPAYNHLEWEEDARKNKEIMKNMCLYPEYLEKQEKEKEQRLRSSKSPNTLRRSASRMSEDFGQA